jgi:hypothetical protein
VPKGRTLTISAKSAAADPGRGCREHVRELEIARSAVTARSHKRYSAHATEGYAMTQGSKVTTIEPSASLATVAKVLDHRYVAPGSTLILNACDRVGIQCSLPSLGQFLFVRDTLVDRINSCLDRDYGYAPSFCSSPLKWLY